MNIIDCPWEYENLGKHTCEISLSRDDVLDEDRIRQLCLQYEYIVVKIETVSVMHSIQLSNLGFSFAEALISIQKDFHNSTNPNHIVEFYKRNSSIELVENSKQLEDILMSITPNMFTTDRISLDPQFGSEYTLIRYRNWIKTEFNRGKCLYKLKYKSNIVGFLLCKQDGDDYEGILGGVYESYQNRGLGIILPLFPDLLEKNVHQYKTNISSNNLSVLSLYECLNYRITNLKYVFIKHN